MDIRVRIPAAAMRETFYVFGAKIYGVTEQLTRRFSRMFFTVIAVKSNYDIGGALWLNTRDPSSRLRRFKQHLY